MDKNGKVISVPALKVEVVDTIGAGDAFAAGFLAARLAGKDMKTCLTSGVESATDAVGLVGGQPDNSNEF